MKNFLKFGEDKEKGKKLLGCSKNKLRFFQNFIPSAYDVWEQSEKTGDD
jgi:hypothetical protein